MTAKEAVEALAALAHEHRLAAFRLLVEAGPNGLPAGLVAERLHLPPSSLSFHLQQLFRAQLTTQRRLSRQIFYAANFATMNALVGYLTKNCCGQEEGAVCATPVCKPSAQAHKAGATIRRRSA
jgi:DNA-binding transcriptional ArsR family regulator